MRQSLHSNGYFRSSRVCARYLLGLVFVTVFGLFVSACTIFDGEKNISAAVDTGLVTGSIKRPMLSRIDKDLTADGNAMLDVIAVLAENGGGTRRSWENAETGNRGALFLLEKPRKITVAAQPVSYSGANTAAGGNNAGGGNADMHGGGKQPAQNGVQNQNNEQSNKAEQVFAVCCLFQTTRESFDGALMYKGEACKYGQNPWSLSFLRPQ